MAYSESAFGNEQVIREAVRLHSGLFMAQGVIMTLLGIAAIIWPQISSVAVDIYVGWAFLFSGIVGLGMMFLAPNVAGFLWSLLTGALAAFAGILLLWHPVEGVVSLTLVLIAFFIVEGLFQIAAAITYRSAFPDGWIWMVMSGIADLDGHERDRRSDPGRPDHLGMPGSAAWALGLIVGVNLITSGVATAIVASAARRATDVLGKAAR